MKQENIINKLKAEIIRLKSLLHGMCLDLKHAEEVRKKLVKKIKGEEMNIDEDKCKFVTKNPHAFSAKYGVMGLPLGRELKSKLDNYCSDRSIVISKLIKSLIEEYLNQKDI